jgi:predicted  nucleic acid-binding Zn-ribbon protein
MSNEAEVVLTDDEEEQAYLDAFNEANAPEREPSAGSEDGEAGESSKSDDSPDEKIQDDDGEQSSSEAGTASDEPQKEKPDPYAWIDDLPADVQKQAKALQHRVASSDGRVAALQRRAQEADDRAAARAVAAKSRQKMAAASTSTEDEELSPKLKEFTEQYPQLAESVKEMVSKERTDLEELIASKLEPIEQEAAYREISKARNRLEEGASEIFDTANSGVHYTDVLKSELYAETFLKSQPQEFQRLATTTSDPDTALWVLDQFSTWAERYAKENGLMEEDDTEAKSRADKTSEKRSKQKGTAGTPAPRSAHTDPEADTDYVAYFKHINS